MTLVLTHLTDAKAGPLVRQWPTLLMMVRCFLSRFTGLFRAPVFDFWVWIWHGAFAYVESIKLIARLEQWLQSILTGFRTNSPLTLARQILSEAKPFNRRWADKQRSAESPGKSLNCRSLAGKQEWGPCAQTNLFERDGNIKTYGGRTGQSHMPAPSKDNFASVQWDKGPIRLHLRAVSASDCVLEGEPQPVPCGGFFLSWGGSW